MVYFFIQKLDPLRFLDDYVITPCVSELQVGKSERTSTTPTSQFNKLSWLVLCDVYLSTCSYAAFRHKLSRNVLPAVISWSWPTTEASILLFWLTAKALALECDSVAGSRFQHPWKKGTHQKCQNTHLNSKKWPGLQLTSERDLRFSFPVVKTGGRCF